MKEKGSKNIVYSVVKYTSPTLNCCTFNVDDPRLGTVGQIETN